MTIQERLRTIGRAIRGQTDVVEVVKEVPKKDKAIGTGFFDLGIKSLTTEKSVSTRLIASYLGWVYANVSVIAEEVSKVELKLYQTNFKGGELVLDEIPEHPALEILDRFNESTASGDAFYLTSVHQELAGDSFWYIDGKGADIKGIFLLQPDEVTINPTKVIKDPRKLIDSYTWKGNRDGQSFEFTYDPDEIIQFSIPNPAPTLRGKSGVEAAAQAIDTDNLANEASRKFFENGMIANFGLFTEQKVTPEQIKQMQAQLRATKTGAFNAFKVAIMGGGLVPKPLQMSNKEVELIKLQEWYRDKIMTIFKNTKASLGIVEDVNRANAEASLAGWKRSVVKPKMQRIVDNLNEFYLPRFGDNLVFGFEDPVPEDRAALIKEAMDIYGNAQKPTITLNEAREILGYDAVQEDGADDVKQPMPVTDTIPEPVKNVKYVRHFRRLKLYSRLKKYQKDYKKALPVAKSIIKARKKKVSRTRVNRFHKRLIDIVDKLELIFEQKAQKYIQRLVEEAAHSLEDEEARGTGDLFDREKKLLEAQAEFAPVLTQAIVQAGNEANRLLGIDQVYMPKSIKQLDSQVYIREQIELFAGSLLDTDKKKMAKIIAGGLETGLSIPQIRQKLLDEFVDFSRAQAERITRTEVMRAANAAVNDSYKESGVVTGEQWLASPDACEYCAPLQGKLVSLDEDFFSKGDEWFGDAKVPMKLDYEDVGEPPLHPNCRCTTIPVIVDTEPLLKQPSA